MYIHKVSTLICPLSLIVPLTQSNNTIDVIKVKLFFSTLAVLFEEAVILGASNEAMDLKSPGKSDVTFPFYSIDRTVSTILLIFIPWSINAFYITKPLNLIY